MINYKLNTFNKLKSMMEHNQLYYNVTNDYVDISNFKKITNIRYNTLTDKCHIMLDEVLEIEFVLDLIYNIFANAAVRSEKETTYKFMYVTYFMDGEHLDPTIFPFSFV